MPSLAHDALVLHPNESSDAVSDRSPDREIDTAAAPICRALATRVRTSAIRFALSDVATPAPRCGSHVAAHVADHLAARARVLRAPRAALHDRCREPMDLRESPAASASQSP